ncbi:hypothetical protein KNP414_00965 [Paenibacillus mucilaginosus KNP414]|uniref:Uncharacterized protein n=1 Tax=Paenibacillus mucilaginosus (strain KNP414) TaxID=1036673 RepID=F8FAA2_PAEMK|nr:hypothetical protein KNP414_00965 [Paenibacillus mucilaginosus KNP414]
MTIRANVISMLSMAYFNCLKLKFIIDLSFVRENLKSIVAQEGAVQC